MKFSQFGPQISAFNHLLCYVSGLMVSQGWDRKEGCGTGAASCGDTKGDNFGNSKEMEHLMQRCRGVRDHSPPEGTAGFILGTWLAYVKDWWAMRLESKWI